MAMKEYATLSRAFDHMQTNDSDYYQIGIIT